MTANKPDNKDSKILDPLLLFFYRRIARKLPARWFRPELPVLGTLENKSTLKLEIVSHCWNYSHLLDYQLSSYILNPPRNCEVTVTVFHSPEDTGTVASLNYFGAIAVEGVTWNWQPLPRDQLFRRAIGRNMAALSTRADWVWFADCDLIFAESVLDNIVRELKACQEIMVFPGYEYISSLLPAGDAVLRESEPPNVATVDEKIFSRREINRAVGAFQIVRGDLLRETGYCANIPYFQKPTQNWQKTYEDTIFRWLIGTEGHRLRAGGTYRIRHQEKGRYNGNPLISKLRKKLRSTQRYR